MSIYANKYNFCGKFCSFLHIWQVEISEWWMIPLWSTRQDGSKYNAIILLSKLLALLLNMHNYLVLSYGQNELWLSLPAILCCKMTLWMETKLYAMLSRTMLANITLMLKIVRHYRTSIFCWTKAFSAHSNDCRDMGCTGCAISSDTLLLAYIEIYS